jgi:hypothetical protein
MQTIHAGKYEPRTSTVNEWWLKKRDAPKRRTSSRTNPPATNFATAVFIVRTI